MASSMPDTPVKTWQMSFNFQNDCKSHYLHYTTFEKSWNFCQTCLLVSCGTVCVKQSCGGRASSLRVRWSQCQKVFIYWSQSWRPVKRRSYRCHAFLRVYMRIVNDIFKVMNFGVRDIFRFFQG